MADSAQTNAEVWKTDAGVAQWVATADERELRRAWPRSLMAELLPFAPGDEFTFVDLGAGTGAAARTVLERYEAATGVLADYSSQMMEECARRTFSYTRSD